MTTNVGGQHIKFGCASEETEDAMSSHTLDGNSFGDEIERRAQEWCLRLEQSPDIAGGVPSAKDDFDVGEGGQDIMFGCASEETEDAMSLTRPVATRLRKKMDRLAQEW